MVGWGRVFRCTRVSVCAFDCPFVRLCSRYLDIRLLCARLAVHFSAVLFYSVSILFFFARDDCLLFIKGASF